jgi:hypothetical protein
MESHGFMVGIPPINMDNCGWFTIASATLWVLKMENLQVATGSVLRNGVTLDDLGDPNFKTSPHHR